MRVSLQVTRDIGQLLALKNKQQTILETKLNKLCIERQDMESEIGDINEKRLILRIETRRQHDNFQERVVGRVTTIIEITNLQFELDRIKQEDNQLCEQIELINENLAILDEEIAKIREQIQMLCKKHEKYNFLQSGEFLR